MTQKQLDQCIAQLPAGQKFSLAYTAFEGGIRFFSVDRNGNEYRYRVTFDSTFNASTTPF